MPPEITFPEEPRFLSVTDLDSGRLVEEADDNIRDIVSTINAADRGEVRLKKRSGKVTITITVTGHADEPGAFVIESSVKTTLPPVKPRITRAVDDHGVLLKATDPEQMRLVGR